MRHTHPVDPYALDLDAVNIADPCLFSDGDPHAVWLAMRARDPVRWQDLGGNNGFWSVTKHADVAAVLRDSRTFTSEGGTTIGFIGYPDPASGQQMSVTDPPHHTKMRAPLQRLLAGQGPVRYAPAIADQVRKVLAPGLTGEPFDFADAMQRLPMAAFGTMMGIPVSDWDEVARLAATVISFSAPVYRHEDGPDAAMRGAQRELFAYFLNLAAERRRNLGEDLLSSMLTMEVDGERLTPGAIMANCNLLMIGSILAVPEVPKSAILELITTGRYADWARHPELMDESVSEALRWGTPANHAMRYATRTVEIRGTQINAGDPLVAWFPSANRDNEVFADPYTFNVRRASNRFLTFGSGPHYCLGFGVTRLTLQLLFEGLGASYESFELAGEVVHLRSNFIAGITRMPVVGSPRSGVRHRRSLAAI